jgi:hypothetical protein
MQQVIQKIYKVSATTGDNDIEVDYKIKTIGYDPCDWKKP